MLADFLRRLIQIQVPAHRLRRERRNLTVFALACAMLALFAGFQTHARLAAEAERGEPRAGDAFGAASGLTQASLRAAEPGSWEEKRIQAVADHLAKRYLVSAELMREYAGVAHRAGAELGLDPLLIIAVMSIESGFNPIAESVAGAKGLMQVIPRYHPEKFARFGGQGMAFDPHANIRVGAYVLREYIDRTGNLAAGLQFYAGAADDEAQGYANKVMAERQRLQRIASQVRA